MTTTLRFPIAVTASLLGLVLVATGCSVPAGRCGIEDECAPIRMHDPFRHDRCVPPKGTDPGHFGYARPQWRVLDERIANCCSVTEATEMSSPVEAWSEPVPRVPTPSGPIENGPEVERVPTPSGPIENGPEVERVPTLPEVEPQRDEPVAPRGAAPAEPAEPPRRSGPENPFSGMSDQVLQPVEGPLRPTRYVIEPELGESDYWRQP